MEYINGSRITLNILNGLINDELDARLQAKGLRLAITIDSLAGVLRGTTHWKVRFANSCRFTKWLARTLFKTSLDVLGGFSI